MLSAFTLTEDPINLPNGASARNKRINIAWKGKAILSLSQNDYRNYIYPLFTPSGISLTAESPIDHPHHQSISIGADHFNCYLPFGDDKFEEANYNFYVNYTFQGRAPGRIISKSIENKEITENHLRVIQTLFWQGPEEWGAPNRRHVATEKRVIDIYPGQNSNIVDITSILHPTKWEIKIGPTRHGYFTIRLADGLRMVDGGTLWNSDRLTGQEVLSNVNSQWIDAYGPSYMGHKVGLAIFPYGNTGYDSWGISDYGIITINPLLNKKYTLRKDSAIEFAVRIVAHEGDTYEAKIEELHKDFIENFDNSIKG